jgi:ubiquinone/menaquinone biosynthesis C-methylase UbiE
MAHVDYSGPMAEVYDAGRSLAPAVVDVWAEAARRRLGERGSTAWGHPLLDLGAGTGRFSDALSTRIGVPVVALEPAPPMRDQARLRAGALVRHVGGRAEHLPFGAATFSGVWASQVLHHVADLERCARELRRVLVPTGLVLVRGMLGPLGEQWPLAPYFPGAVEIAEERFPGLAEIAARFASAGLALLAHDRITQVTAPDPQALVQRAAWRADSTLAMLADDEFEAGLAHLQRAVDESDVEGPVIETLDLVVFG